MRRWHYLYAGLRIASEIHLPELQSFEQLIDGEEDDVTIACGEIPDTEIQADGGRIVSDVTCHFAVPGVGSFCVSNGRKILVQRSPDAALRQVRQWLLGSAWGALCYQRGLFLIHASAIMVGDQAVLFCALSKGGKSTLAARLGAQGYPLISDDLCHIKIPETGYPGIYRSAPRLKLWADALQILDSQPRWIEQDASRAGKFHVTQIMSTEVNAAVVTAIYLLEWGDLGIGRLSGASALRRFWAASTYRPELLGSPEQLGRYTSQSLSVLQRVPVWELRRPRNLEAMSETVELLASHWAERRMISI